MELKEIIRELIPRHYPSQRALAAALSSKPPKKVIAQGDVQRLQSAGRNQEKQFMIFLKLAKLCDELGIDYAKPEEKSSGKGAQSNAKPNGEKNRGAPQRGKNSLEAEIISVISPRGTLLHPGKGKRRD